MMIKYLLLCLAWMKISGSMKENKSKQDNADAIFDRKRRKY